MKLKFADVVVTIILNIIHFINSEDILSCNPALLNTCKDNQICNQLTSKCECITNYIWKDDECIEAHDDVPALHRGTIAVVTIFSVALVVFGLALIVKKYNLLHYVRDRINFRRNNDVMYEDVMIGQDDPPLSP